MEAKFRFTPGCSEDKQYEIAEMYQNFTDMFGILDPYHFLKLPRNVFIGVNVSSPAGNIEFKCITKLNILQETGNIILQIHLQILILILNRNKN